MNIELNRNRTDFNPHDIVGHEPGKFGRWKVIKYSFDKDMKRFYLCECECGVTQDVMRGNLLSGDSESCGCLRDEISSKYMKGKAHHQMIKRSEHKNIKNSSKRAKELAKDYGVSIYTIRKIRSKTKGATK